MNLETIIKLMSSGLDNISVSITYGSDCVAFSWQYECRDQSCDDKHHIYCLYIDKNLIADETTGGWVTVVNQIKEAKGELIEHLNVIESENVTYLH